MIRSLLKRFFGLLGKSDHRIIAVYAASGPGSYREAVEYVRAEAPEFPVWLLASGPVDAEVAQKCERVFEFRSGFRLPVRVAQTLWPHWVVLNVVIFTGEPGFGWLKAAPFFVLPGRLLVMNENRDFFDGSPLGLARHLGRRARDRAWTASETAKDLFLGVFWKLAWTLLDPLLALTAKPWLRPQEPPPLLPGGEPERRQGILTWRRKDGDLDSLAAASTNYKYILVIEEEQEAQGDPANLLAPLERPDTFAAGFQPGRAGFQKDILPRAAFRQLQPGESAAVVAPLADLVLLDAEKLARLGGFPPARSRRCRWLLLYWRAARAGWRCYSVGVERARTPMIPDRAFAEAEFCFRLLGERPRPRPESGSFDARRGSVCCHPRYGRTLRQEARRILVVSPYLPFPLSHGGAVRIFNLARLLSERWDLLLVTFREREDRVDYARLSCWFARVIVVDQDERRARDPSVPEAVAQFRSRAMGAAIREAVENYSPALLQVEYTHLAGYREAAPQTPAVLVEHDVTFSLHEQLYLSAASEGERRRARAEYDRWRRYESHWLKQYDAVAVMSDEEKGKAVAAGAPESRTWVVPNGVDTERFHPAESEAEGSPEILYVGSFRHLPNVLGFEYLRKEVMPGLWARFPDLRLRVVAGPEHERHWRQFAGRPWQAGGAEARIEVEGFVEDLAPYYARARVVAAPLTVSAGTNIKVMEALACGKPVVSTPIGCAGLGLAAGEEILVAAEAAGFRGAIERLLEQDSLRRRMGERARRAAVERFSWERAAQRAAEMYEAVWSVR